MTKEEAIKLIDDRMCFGRGKWSEHHKPEIDIYWQAGEMAIKALEAEPHWIPVTKDLPKESGHYIVTTRTVCLPINLLHPELDRYSNNVRIDYFRAYDNKFDLPSTVAWWSEPLPEPYEGVTE